MAVYVVVKSGVTGVLPLPGGVTCPTPWSITVLTALAAVHDSVDASPALIVSGLAVRLTVGKSGVTVTVADAVTVW